MGYPSKSMKYSYFIHEILVFSIPWRFWDENQWVSFQKKLGPNSTPGTTQLHHHCHCHAGGATKHGTLADFHPKMESPGGAGLEQWETRKDHPIGIDRS
jgi:hypothetical protein